MVGNAMDVSSDQSNTAGFDRATIRQAVFLVGGFGTRLGHLTQTTPKPLIEVAGGPFLDILIEEAARHGFDDILLLGGYLGEQMMARYDGKRVRGSTVRVLVEPEPLGTGGALKFALPRLAPQFLLANGDTFFDINLRALAADVPRGGGVMALRSGVGGTRYGRVGFESGLVRSFHAPGERDHSPINGGIYALDRAIVDRIGDGPVSLEGAVFPDLAREGRLEGQVFSNYFIDIGIPEDLARACAELPARLTRPALFLDRDGVLNTDKGYLHKREDFDWIEGARQAVRLANDRGWFVFVVTNQAGVARGLYEERDIAVLHAFMQQELAATGAHIDAFEYCPHHPEGTRNGYDKVCGRRKPGPGMILDLLKSWPVDAGRSFLIGDMPHDVAAAEAAGLNGYRFEGGSLLDFVKPLLD
jgi:D,D-heptose 1,7-bisphosphate phosphatase